MIEVRNLIRINGIIGRVEQIGNSLFWLEDGSSYSLSDKAVKYSKNIIDLIEVGDYVNGHKIIMDLKQSRKHYITIDCFVTAKDYTFEENEIQTILSKQQYMQNCYKIDTNQQT